MIRSSLVKAWVAQPAVHSNRFASWFPWRPLRPWRLELGLVRGKNHPRAGNAAAYRGFERSGVGARSIVAGEVEAGDGGALGRPLDADHAGEGRALLGDDPAP